MNKQNNLPTNSETILKYGIIPELGTPYRGKVRDCYTIGDKLLFITSDRISAFDVIMGRGVPLKGQVLNQLASFWFELTKDIIPNHLVEMVDPNCMLINACEPYKVEVVVRRYLSGSAWRAYQERGELCGIKLPRGLKQDDRLPELILTPTTKAAAGHDEEISREEIIKRKLVPVRVYAQIEKSSKALFSRGEEYLKKRGFTLVDTKYEFGHRDGQLMLMDEMHTPDSSRFWEGTKKEQDKEYLRRWLREHDFSGNGKPPELTDEIVQEITRRYLYVYEKITGAPLQVVDYPIKERIIHNLKKNDIIRGYFVVVLIASPGDSEWGQRIQKELTRLEIPSCIRVGSAHKTPEHVLKIMGEYEESIEPVVYITVAGRSDALSGMVAANTRFPVIACPPSFNTMDIFSSLRTPSNVPPMVVIEPENAALAAAKIFGLPLVRETIALYKSNLVKEDGEKNQ